MAKPRVPVRRKKSSKPTKPVLKPLRITEAKLAAAGENGVVCLDKSVEDTGFLMSVLKPTVFFADISEERLSRRGGEN